MEPCGCQGFCRHRDDDLLKARLLGDVLIITAQKFSSSPTETQFDIHIKGITAPEHTFNTNTGYRSYHLCVSCKKTAPLDEWITSAAQTGSVTVFQTGYVLFILYQELSSSMLKICWMLQRSTIW